MGNRIRKLRSAMLRQLLRRMVPIGLVLCLAGLSACAGQGGGTNTAEPGRTAPQAESLPGGAETLPETGSGMRILATDRGGSGTDEEAASLPLLDINGVSYVSVDDIVRVLEYRMNFDETSKLLQIGDFDPSAEMTIDSAAASRDEEPVTLSHPPVMRSGKVYLSVDAVGQLLQEDMTYAPSAGVLKVLPSPLAVSRAEMEGPDDTAPTGELDFAEDPNDPFRGDEGTDPTPPEKPITMNGTKGKSGSSAAIPAAKLKNIDTNKLIRDAKRYLGVKYSFGTGSYPSSGRFDCSSFTRYIYGKQDVSLPRTARAQAKRGNQVKRTSLRKGDLMYFYVPGRFKSNKTVGHVGIYMGNFKMIHSSPEPKNGVQITSINKAYWKKTFLYAKRIVY